jgi:hypothetical protein
MEQICKHAASIRMKRHVPGQMGARTRACRLVFQHVTALRDIEEHASFFLEQSRKGQGVEIACAQLPGHVRTSRSPAFELNDN